MAQLEARRQWAIREAAEIERQQWAMLARQVRMANAMHAVPKADLSGRLLPYVKALYLLARLRAGSAGPRTPEEGE